MSLLCHTASRRSPDVVDSSTSHDARRHPREDGSGWCVPTYHRVGREDAAGYVGLSATKFDELVAGGRMPRPLRIDGCVRWDRRTLDAAVDALLDGEDGLEFAA